MIRLALLGALLFWISPVIAEELETPAFHVGGLLFGDLYYLPSNHLENGDKAAGLVVRRAYFTVDADFSKNWFGRARVELNQSGEFETYTFDSELKDLYLGWNMGRQRFLLGKSPTPTFDLIESIWGYRYLARTPMDLQGTPSRETGLAARGPLNASGNIGYRVMWADNKRLMGALSWKPAPNWTLDFYTDYQWNPGPTDRRTLQAFLAYQSDQLRWGLQYSNQNRQEDPPLKLASGFISRDVGEITSLVGRVDRLLAPSPEGNNIDYLPFDPSAKATMFIGGIEFRVNPYFSVTPNTVVTLYDRNDQGVRPRTDIYLRLTLFFNFQ
jgi:hypothetical protein